VSFLNAWHARPTREHSKGRNEQGAVLFQVILLSVLGLLLSGMLLSGIFVQSHATRREREAPQVFYAAEAGVHHTIQHIVNAVSEEEGEIEQFRVLAALWNRQEPFAGSTGRVQYEARIVDVSPNLAFRAYVRKYTDVTIEAKAHEDGLPPQAIRATYRLRLGPTDQVGTRAIRLQWQRS
jgi:hypothetical protein